MPVLGLVNEGEAIYQMAAKRMMEGEVRQPGDASLAVTVASIEYSVLSPYTSFFGRVKRKKSHKTDVEMKRVTIPIKTSKKRPKTATV